MAYTTIDDPSAYFQTALYSGNAGTQSITNDGNSDLQPDWVWIKQRSGTQNHNLQDSVRGSTKIIKSNTDADETTDANGVTSFNTDGFSIGTRADINQSGTYVAWQWKAGTSFTNDASATGIGATDSAGSVNDTAGFSICTYTGVGGTSTTIKHGLSTAPTVMLIKNRSSAKDWAVYHQGIGNTHRLYLNNTDASTSAIGTFRNTSPTSSIFTVGDHASVNTSGNNYVAYIFAEKQGYSKFGSYTGNGNADGTFVYTGFLPSFVMVKQTNASGEDWFICDTKREGYNAENNRLMPNLSSAESTDSPIDILSNSFKARQSGAAVNGSGASYIYMAFAENPFVTSSGVPACAR